VNEAQFKSLVRFTFFLQGTADDVIRTNDEVLARVMISIREMVKSLPEEGLLRNQSWKSLEGLVKFELSKYSKAFGDSLLRALDAASGRMERYALKEAVDAGADLGTTPVRLGVNGTPAGTDLALKANVGGQPIKKLFDLTSRTDEAGINRAMFKVIDTRVRTGFLRGTPTQEIADLMMVDTTIGGIPGVRLNAPVTRQIRSQAMAVARTATQSMAREVKETVYAANADALEGLVWEWEAALDSRTCPTCMPLDQQRWDQGDSSRPDWPLHPNCRCQCVLVDPEDTDFADQSRTAQQVRPATKRVFDKKTGKYKTVKTKPYTSKGAYQSPVKIKGEMFWRKTITVTSDTPPPRYADVLAKWATDSKTSLVEAMGPQRAAIFKRELDRLNRDPQQILNWMLTGDKGEQQWIPIEQLKKKDPLRKRTGKK